MLTVRILVREDTEAFHGVLSDVSLRGLSLLELLFKAMELVLPAVRHAQARERVRALTESRELETA